VLPLIPPADREEQIARWLGIGRHLFWRDRFPGFWPPELGFSMELVTTLSHHRYEYVIVDSEHVRPLTPMSWEELRYRPHHARVGKAEIVVVVRDRDLSNAQESGMEAGWFIDEVRERTQHCDFPPLVTTATDGDNGGWFRNTTHGSNFWSSFYADLVERVRAGQSGGIHPAFISDYLHDTAPMAGSRSTPQPGTQATTTAPASSNGPARRPSATPWPGSRSSATPCTPPTTRSTTPRAPPSSSSRPAGGCCAPRRAATSTGARPGCSAATTTSTKPPGT
jgi:Glycosyl hydrolase family 57